MRKLITLLLCLVFFKPTDAQTESVHLHINKQIFYPGDTCWFAGYVFEDNHLSNYSKNLIVELFDAENKLAVRKVFPIANGYSIGQIELPKNNGLYWVRSYTRNSSYFLQSLTIRSIDNAVVVRNLLDYKESPVTTEVHGLLINSIYTDKGISCTIFPGPDTKYNYEQFKLVLNYYDAKIGEYSFSIDKKRQKNILISRDSLQQYVHGYVTLSYYRADTLIAKQDLFIPQREIPIELVKDTGGYIFRIKDSTHWTYSLSVVRSEIEDIVASPNILHCLTPSELRRVSDTSYLAFEGTVTRSGGKKGLIKDEDMVVMLGKDSLARTNLVHIDHSGKLSISNLYFFDTTYVNYMLNGYVGDKLNNINITLSPQEYPLFVVPDSTDYETDTFNVAPASLELPQLDSLKYLKPVYVESTYKKALDNRYATGRFSWPVHFSFDLIRANKYNYAILDYLNLELPWFSSNIFGMKAPCFKSHPVVFYLDEQLINWRELTTLYINDLAYVKVIEDFVDDDRYIRMISDIEGDIHPNLKDPYGADNAPSAMICVYRRKGKDFRLIDGKLRHLPIRGYDTPLNFVHPNRSAIFWSPYINSREYKLALSLSKDCSYKIIAEGVNNFGETFHFEKLLH